MAKRPEVGAVYAMPAGNRLEGICRVIAKQGKRLLVVASPWLGKKATVATLGEPAARAILRVTHHAWERDEVLLWIDDPLPKQFRYLGTLAPTAGERQRTCNSYGGWEAIRLHPLLQWRWDHERAKVLAEDAKEQAREDAAIAKARAKEASRKPPALASLRRKKWFAAWERDVPKRLLAKVRDLLRDFTKRQPDVEKALAGCVRALNTLDAQHRFIFTDEREGLHDALIEIAWAAGVDRERAADIIDEHRDW